MQIDSFKRNSCLKIEKFLNYHNILKEELSDWCNNIAKWPIATDKWLTHYELSKNGDRVLCRNENFVN